MVRFRLFLFSLKDKAYAWLYSVRLRSIATWTGMVREFLKRFFPPHKTNTLRRHILNFKQRGMNLSLDVGSVSMNHSKPAHINATRHGELIASFYDGLTSQMRQFVEMMVILSFSTKTKRRHETSWNP